MKKNVANFLTHSLFSNYVKIAFRTLAKNKLTAFINITSLVIGWVSAILIGLFVVDEAAYDQHFRYKDRIYRLTSTYTGEAVTGKLCLPD